MSLIKILSWFDAGHFTAQKTSRLFSAIALDQAHEQVNACIKGDGGAVGLTDDPNALRRWMIAGPEVARAIGEFQDAMEPVHRDNTEEPLESKHHKENESWQKLFVKDVRSLTSSIEELGNQFEEDSKELLTMDTKQIAYISVIEPVRSAYKIGKDQFDLFVKERLMERKVSVDEVLSRNKLTLFTTKHLSEKKGKQQLMLMKSDMQLFSRLYIACQTLDGNLDEFFRHENQSCPPSLSNMGNLRLGGKSDLLHCLENLSAAKSEAPAVTDITLDGPAIVQMLKPGISKTFEVYAKEVFLPYISLQLCKATRIDPVWDIYLNDSLKGTARLNRGQGIRRRVVETGVIPGNWQNFLRVDSNKTELFSYLSQIVAQMPLADDKQVYVTNGEQVLSNPRKEDNAALNPCGHEEADTRIMLHVAHAARHGHSKILIRTVHTDVVAIAVRIFQLLEALQ